MLPFQLWATVRSRPVPAPSFLVQCPYLVSASYTSYTGIPGPVTSLPRPCPGPSLSHPYPSCPVPTPSCPGPVAPVTSSSLSPVSFRSVPAQPRARPAPPAAAVIMASDGVGWRRTVSDGVGKTGRSLTPPLPDLS